MGFAVKQIKGIHSDPDKVAEAIVNVVRGEEVAEGRPWPEHLF